jgi:hypothetical protein
MHYHDIMRRLLHLASGFLALALVARLGVVQADETAPASAEQIASWVNDLDASRFVDRQRASDKLARAGKPAIAELSRAALSDSREASSRAIQILKSHLESRDLEAQHAAQAALERVVESGRPSAAGIARRALNPQPGQAAARALRVGLGDLHLEIRTIDGDADGGAGSRVQINHQTGVKEIDAVIHGERVRIVETPGEGITIDVTDASGERQATRRLTVRDLRDLNAKAPEYFALYEKHLGGGLKKSEAEARTE